jgi:hypothetical protein
MISRLLNYPYMDAQESSRLKALVASLKQMKIHVICGKN